MLLSCESFVVRLFLKYSSDEKAKVQISDAKECLTFKIISFYS